MKAIVVTPGQAGTGRVQEVPTPEPRAGQVLVEVLDVGVCGTDLEILHGLYGEAPPGDDYLILGHENFGRIVSAPEGCGVEAGDSVVCTVRRPDPVPCPTCRAGQQDMCLNGLYTERGIKGHHGFMAEYYVEVPEYLVKLDSSLDDVGVLIEPLSVVEKGIEQAESLQRRLAWHPQEAVVTGAGPIGLMATMLLRSHGWDVWTLDIVPPDSLRAQLVTACGAQYVKGDEESLTDLAKRIPPIDLVVEATAVPQLVFEAITAVGSNGVVCLTGVSASHRTLQVPADALNLDMVLANKVVFGTVNANRHHYEMAARDLVMFNALWPGLTKQVVTRRVPVDEYETALEPRPGVDVKSAVTFR